MKEKEVLKIGNFIIYSGDDGITYYRVKTASPQIEWKVYIDTFMFKIIDKYLEEKNDENLEVLKYHVYALYYACTASDSNLTSLLYAYINNLSENIDAGEDIDIAQAKAAYHAGVMLNEMVDLKDK